MNLYLQIGLITLFIFLIYRLFILFRQYSIHKHIPGYSRFSVFTTYLFHPESIFYFNPYYHNVNFEKYGDTFRETFGGETYVHTKDLALIKEINMKPTGFGKPHFVINFFY
jgi:hypothetical protein